MRIRILAGVVWAAVFAMPASAQTPTGAITGRVVDETGGAVSGVSVRVTSPALQGARETETADRGVYLIPLLPPGDYEVRFERDGFQTAARAVGLAAAQTATVNETLMVSGVEEEVIVVGQSGAFAQTMQVATKFRQDLIATLPTNRTLDAALLMFPGVHPTGPTGNYTINGATSYESAFSVNGVSITENLRGQPVHMYIEDALQETTVVSSGVSAEHGRFAGGIVNAVTKSGGNAFSGSYRASFANDSWRADTPFPNDDPVDQIVPTHEYTFGGPLAQDRLWFFNAGRFQEAETAQTTSAPTAIPYVRNRDEKRYEGKVTFSPAVGQTITGSYLRADILLDNFTQFNVLDLASLAPQEQNSQLWSLHYAAAWGGSLFTEAQFSGRQSDIFPSGSRSTDLIDGTMVQDMSRGGARFWSPTFCAVCGPDNRDSNDIVFKTTYFWPEGVLGSHTLVAGYDRYNDHREANNYQSGSNFRIQAPAAVIQGTTVYPIFVPGPTFIITTPISQLSQGTDLITHSAFVNDEWRYNDRMSVNLGLRFDRNQAEDASGAPVSNDSKVSPRLGVVVDPTGTGQWTAAASFANYVSGLSTTIADVSAAGNPAVQVWLYGGPVINAAPNQPLTPTREALEQLFGWFFANGGTARPSIFHGLPSVNTRIDGPLKSPNSNEVALSLERQLRRGSVRADFVHRSYGDFYAHRTDLSTGRVTNDNGQLFDLTLVENTDRISRRYRALSLQGTQRIGSRVNLGGNYTLSRAWGNFDGESANAGPGATPILAYPEYQQEPWFSPEGDLSIDQRHRLRLWGVYDVPVAEAVGTLNVAVLHQYGSGVPYGALGRVDTRPFVVNPGYVQPTGNQSGFWDYYFTPRDAFRTEGTNRTDLSTNYAYRIAAGRRSVELFVHAEVLNLFNTSQLCLCGDTVFENGGNVDLTKVDRGVLSPGQGGLQPFNALTTTPVEGVNWAYGPGFGGAVDRFAYTSPRTFRFNFGARF